MVLIRGGVFGIVIQPLDADLNSHRENEVQHPRGCAEHPVSKFDGINFTTWEFLLGGKYSSLCSKRR